MKNHDFFVVSVGHYDSSCIRYIRPLKIFASLSGAKNYVFKRRKKPNSFMEIDWYCIHRLNFDCFPLISDFWVCDQGGDWSHGKD